MGGGEEVGKRFVDDGYILLCVMVMGLTGSSSRGWGQEREKDTKYHEVTGQNIFSKGHQSLFFFPCCLALTPFHTGKIQTEIKIKIPGWLHVASWAVQLSHRLY